MSTMLIGHVRGTKYNNIKGLLIGCAEEADVELRIDMIKTGFVAEVVFYTVTGQSANVKLFEATLKHSVDNHPGKSLSHGEKEDPNADAMAIGILFGVFIVGIVVVAIFSAIGK